MAMAKRKKNRGGLFFKLLLLAVLIGGGYWLYLQYQQRNWRPDVEAYPDQGALVGENDGAVDF